jgi:hypothetical protein
MPSSRPVLKQLAEAFPKRIPAHLEVLTGDPFLPLHAVKA